MSQPRVSFEARWRDRISIGVTRKGSAGRSRLLQRSAVSRPLRGVATGGHLRSNDRQCLGIG
jgi:hypothetical protein